MKKTSIAISIIAALLLGASAQAALIITIEEVGDAVVATVSGTINMDALTATGSSGNLDNGVILGSAGQVIAGGGAFTYYNGAAGGEMFGTNEFPLTGDSSTGDAFGIYAHPSFNYIAVSQSYVSGAQMNATTTWNNQTFATLGLDETSFTMTWGSGATADSMTMNAAVPEPATAGLLGISGLILFGIRRFYGRA